MNVLLNGDNRNSYMDNLSDILKDLTLEEEDNSKSSNVQSSKKNTVFVNSLNSSKSVNLNDLTLEEKNFKSSDVQSSKKNTIFGDSPNSSNSVNSVTQQSLPSEQRSSDKSDVSYTSDFSNDSGTTSVADMTAWEKWFVMKQEKIRKAIELEVKRKEEEINKIKYQEYLKKRKMKESEKTVKIWLERKECEKTKGENIEVKHKRVINNPEYTFKSWYLRKCREKKIDLLLKEYHNKIEEEEKKNKLKQSKKAVKKWMSKVKRRPRKLRTISASWGGSSINYHDPTKPPSPSYINPRPWRDP